MRIVLIFIDGLGIGDRYPEKNPCVHESLKYFNNYFDHGRLVPSEAGNGFPLDAMLDVDGLPQSATGQTALLTGINASRYIGRHLQGFPNQRLRDLLKEHAISKVIKECGLRPVFVNVYRPEFFQLPEKIQWRLSATTIANLASGLPFMTLKDLREGKALYHDFTNHCLAERGFEVPLYSPEQAGTILADISQKYDFVLYEYFITDRIGHHQNLTMARKEIRKLDRFFSAFLAQADLINTLVIVTSDHGNIEDVSVKTHTKNPVMTLIAGAGSGHFTQKLKSITDIAPAIFQYLGIDHV